MVVEKASCDRALMGEETGREAIHQRGGSQQVTCRPVLRGQKHVLGLDKRWSERPRLAVAGVFCVVCAIGPAKRTRR